MALAPGFLRIPRPEENAEPLVVKFVRDIPADSRIWHWVHEADGPSRDQECAGANCQHCLSGHRVLQQFAVVVEHAGQRLTWAMPLAPYQQILAHKQRFGPRQFWRKEFRVFREGQVLSPIWRIEAI